MAVGIWSQRIVFYDIWAARRVDVTVVFTDALLLASLFL
jgi:hypothetical protein